MPYEHNLCLDDGYVGKEEVVRSNYWFPTSRPEVRRRKRMKEILNLK